MTIELREHELYELSKQIFGAIRNDKGQISASLLVRFNDRQTFPACHLNWQMGFSSRVKRILSK